MQRVNVSDGYPNDPCSLQIKDGTYIALLLQRVNTVSFMLLKPQTIWMR